MEERENEPLFKRNRPEIDGNVFFSGRNVLVDSFYKSGMTAMS